MVDGGGGRAVVRPLYKRSKTVNAVSLSPKPRTHRPACLIMRAALNMSSWRTVHGQHAFQVQLGFHGGVLHAWAQRQFQAIALGAQVGDAGGVAIHALIGAPDGFFFGAVVVHHKGIPVEGQVTAGQGAEIDALARVRP